MTESTATVSISKAAQAQIDHWLLKFPEDKKQSALLAALRIVQKENKGWLSNAHLDAIAAYLEIPVIAVYEVATFYTLYHLNPVGRHKILLCTNVSCFLCGSKDIAAYLKEKLKIGFKETTEDGKFTLIESECLGACGGAPMMMVEDTYYENLTPAKIDAILDALD